MPCTHPRVRSDRLLCGSLSLSPLSVVLAHIGIPSFAFGRIGFSFVDLPPVRLRMSGSFASEASSTGSIGPHARVLGRELVTVFAMGPGPVIVKSGYLPCPSPVLLLSSGSASAPLWRGFPPLRTFVPTSAATAPTLGAKNSVFGGELMPTMTMGLVGLVVGAVSILV